MTTYYIACDLGAESGRVIVGTLNKGKLLLSELHRFPNTPVRVPGALYWDILRLWHEIQHGIGVATRERKLVLDGIGIDTWGVDFGLLGRGAIAAGRGLSWPNGSPRWRSWAPASTSLL